MALPLLPCRATGAAAPAGPLLRIPSRLAGQQRCDYLTDKSKSRTRNAKAAAHRCRRTSAAPHLIRQPARKAASTGGAGALSRRVHYPGVRSRTDYGMKGEPAAQAIDKSRVPRRTPAAGKNGIESRGVISTVATRSAEGPGVGYVGDPQVVNRG